MPPRNGYKGSGKGRSAMARKAKFGGASPTNGMQAKTVVFDQNGKRHLTHDYGGPTKAGGPPSATGFMDARVWQVAQGNSPPATKPNFFFQFKTQLGPKPWGY